MNKRQDCVLVSVITPTFNCLSHIDQVVESVSKQTLMQVEHIVIDDGSTDGSLERLRALEIQFDDLKVLSQSNKGAGPARNAGITEARGRYIAFLDSDDRWHPTKLEVQIRFMETHGVEFSYGDYRAVDATSGEVLTNYRLPTHLSYEQLLDGCPIGCLTAAYNQELVGKKYMPLIRRGQDWALWLALTRNSIVAQKYPGNLASYTYRSASLSQNKLKKLFDVYRIYTREERIGYLPALLHLLSHVRYAVPKKSKLSQ